jgi:hypothetical protein
MQVRSIGAQVRKARTITAPVRAWKRPPKVSPGFDGTAIVHELAQTRRKLAATESRLAHTILKVGIVDIRTINQECPHSHTYR